MGVGGYKMEVKFLERAGLLYQGWLVVNANRGPKPEEKGGWWVSQA